MDKYYIVECDNVGPNAKPLNREVMITTEPPRTNSSKEIKLLGWLGTNNDYASYACGEYESLEEAKRMVEAKHPRFKQIELDMYVEDEIICVYKDTREIINVADFVVDSSRGLTADSSEEEIQYKIEELMSEINEDEHYLDGDIEDCVREHVQYLKELKDDRP